MIRDLGPQQRLIAFLEAICTVEGRAITANQEMVSLSPLTLLLIPPPLFRWTRRSLVFSQKVVRLCWMDETTRRQIFLETTTFSSKKSKKYGPVRNFSGTVAVTSDVVKDQGPSHLYLGKSENLSANSQVFVYWTGKLMPTMSWSTSC